MGKSKELATYAGGTFATDVILGGSADISMDASSSGQLSIDGNGYNGAIALDSTGMSIYHNSASRSLSLGTNETARLTIDASGRVTMPYQPVFSARHASLSGVNVSTTNTVLGSGFWNATYLQDNLGNFNTSTGRFTAPVSGWYYFGHHIRIDQFSGSYIYNSLYRSDGSLIARNLTNLSWTYNTISCQGISYLNASDYCYVTLYSVGDSSINIDSDGFFVGHLIG